MEELRLDDLDACVRFTDVPGRLPARVYVHGLARSSDAWADIAFDPELAGHRSVLIDLLGYGKSDKPKAFDHRVESHAAVVERVTESLGLEHATVIGHSLGGSIAILLAAKRNDLVGTLVAVEANLDPGGGPMSQAIAAQSVDSYVQEGYGRELEVLTGPRLDMQRAASPLAIHQTSRSLIELTNPSPRELLVDLDIPRVFLVGEATLGTHPTSGEDGAGLAEAGIEVIVIPGASHEVMQENPAGTVAALARALRAEDNAT